MSTPMKILRPGAKSEPLEKTPHSRQASSEFDHMDGSVFSPLELCPHCNCPRRTTVYCPVTKLSHATGTPEHRRETSGVFDRIFNRSRDETESVPAGGSTPDDFMSADSTSKPGQPAAASDNNATTPLKKKFSFFQTKEEKQQTALISEECAERKNLDKEVNTEWDVIAKGLADLQKSVDAMFAALAKKMRVVYEEAKVEIEAMKKSRKNEMAAMEKIYLAELEIVRKIDKDRSKVDKDMEKDRAKIEKEAEEEQTKISKDMEKDRHKLDKVLKKLGKSESVSESPVPAKPPTSQSADEIVRKELETVPKVEEEQEAEFVDEPSAAQPAVTHSEPTPADAQSLEARVGEVDA